MVVHSFVLSHCKKGKASTNFILKWFNEKGFNDMETLQQVIR